MSGMYSGMQLNSDNILKTVSILSPIIVVFFIVMSSLFNQDLKGLVYLAGILIASMINVFLMTQLQSPYEPRPGEFCSLIDLPFFGSAFDSPAPSSVMIAFTAAYLIVPMIFNSQMNYILMAFFLIIFGIDGFYKTSVNCTKTSGVILGGLTGLFLGLSWFILFHSTGYDSLLYFNDFQSNNVMCSKPSKQTFKCSVYKNGQLISSSNM
jgi:hypothetical protein